MSLSLTHKINKTKQSIRSLNRVIVAYSGGVDSTVVAKLATMELGHDALIVISDSPSLPRRELEKAIELSKKHGFNLKIIHTKEIEVDGYKSNPKNRCYYCKRELYSELKELLKDDYEAILDGANIDDLGDFRPGREAAKENLVVSILVEAGLDKKEVREVAKQLGLENWNKPAAACLSSRFPYGARIDSKKLLIIEKAEDYLLSLGIPQLRVRHHDKVARIEVHPEYFDLILKHRAKINQKFSDLGFLYTSLDILGFKSGSLNMNVGGNKEKTTEHVDG